MVNSKPPRGLQLNLTEANNGARAARVTGGSGLVQVAGRLKRGDRLRTGDERGAAVHQVDSRAAAVNTNNGEYRSVNCVLGSVEGGCASAAVPPPSLPSLRCPRGSILSLYPPFIRCPRDFFFFCAALQSRRIAAHLAAITHMCLLDDRPM